MKLKSLTLQEILYRDNNKDLVHEPTRYEALRGQQTISKDPNFILMYRKI